jgi:hypothetical protein
MDIQQELTKIAEKLHQDRIEYALCGGLAMAVHGLLRATMDIDIMVELNSFVRLVRSLECLGFTQNEVPMKFDCIEISRLYKIEESTGKTFILDILIPTDDSLKEVWETRQKVETKGEPIFVVSRQGLIALKSLRNSEQDKADINYLRSLSDED